jgi:hypothetical protein
MYRDIDAAMIEGLNWLGSPNIPARARPGIVELAGGGGAPGVIRASRAPGEPVGIIAVRQFRHKQDRLIVSPSQLQVARRQAIQNRVVEKLALPPALGTPLAEDAANEIVDLDYAAEHGRPSNSC